MVKLPKKHQFGKLRKNSDSEIEVISFLNEVSMNMTFGIVTMKTYLKVDKW